ncbi:AcrR family transcriptional regulator [Nocardia transvalensis]|uniref:AcrR family transcriptional regulator n=1 Tax=Nocardia transvalensis TaxID=37333 RepID=A0A7W9UM81_9NOCA|nr:TetR/AcrR family transcriptional regulator [Nocardia transvalensis]MBB5918092.1 AcrR family transcriptional regulator [Nocardia transvalensis]
MKSGTSCVVCGAPIAQPRRGRRRRYCSRACQARAHRARRDTARLPPRHARPARLTAVGIVRAAVELADREGLQALSMRRLATELSVATAALYRYFPDRAALLGEMAELVLGETPSPPSDIGDWRARLGYEARAEWRLYRRHPWMLPVLAQTRPPVGPALLDSLERSFAALDRPGATRDELMAVYLSVSGLVQGLALLPGSERSPVGAGPDGIESFRATALDLATSGSHPTLARYFGPETTGLEPDFDDLLENALGLLLDGIAARHFPPTDRPARGQ